MNNEYRELWHKHCDEDYHHYYGSIYTFFEALIKCNQQVNFFSRKMQSDQLFMDHFIDCAIALKYFKPYNHILDFGTGGGLPGMILAICFPNKKIILFDKSQKKIHHLNKLISVCKLKNVIAKSEISNDENQKIDCVTSRAVGSLEKITQLCKGLKINQCNDYLLYKARMEKIEEEISDLKLKCKREIITLDMPEKERHLVYLKL
jgi:16S rRNA (guanine527-N7)-methyltransferase